MAKATKKQALGRGLSALLKDPENDIKSVSDKNADKVIGNVVGERRSGIWVKLSPSHNLCTLRERKRCEGGRVLLLRGHRQLQKRSVAGRIWLWAVGFDFRREQGVAQHRGGVFVLTGIDESLQTRRQSHEA